MNKSKHIFLILFFAYVVILVLNIFSVVEISGNVLLGLSLSSLLMAIGDGIENYRNYNLSLNGYNYSVYVTSHFLERKIQQGIVENNGFDICNIKNSVDSLCIIRKEPKHPNEYWKTGRFKWCSRMSTICFSLGVSGFIIIPFIRQEVFTDRISILITVSAFAVMCLNLYLSDLINETGKQQRDFYGDKQLIIQSAFNDYLTYFNQRLYYYDKYIIEKEREHQNVESETELKAINQ